MEVGAPAAGEEHLPLEHEPVDPAAAVQLLVRVVLLGVRHRSEKDRDATLPRALDRAP